MGSGSTSDSFFNGKGHLVQGVGRDRLTSNDHARLADPLGRQDIKPPTGLSPGVKLPTALANADLQEETMSTDV